MKQAVLLLGAVALAGGLSLGTPLGALAAVFGPYTVNTTGDLSDNNTADHVCNDGQGNCSLRAAIQQLNADQPAAAETIKFSINPGGTQVISPTSALPTIAYPAVLDATSQYLVVLGRRVNCRAATGHPCIELSGQNVGGSSGSVKGLDLSGGNSTVKGFSIVSFRMGLYLESAGADAVQGNWLGLAPDGTPAGNFFGIWLQTLASSTVGGLSSGEGNVVSANHYGVDIEMAYSYQIQGNLIGTDPSGTSAMGNTFGIYGFGRGITIGGSVAGARNVISGNSDTGVYLDGSFESAIEGNFIGTDTAGTSAIPNGRGVYLIYFEGGTLGGSSPGQGNVISGNTGVGVDLDSRNVTVQGNSIGTAAVRFGGALGNGGDGIRIPGANYSSTIGGTSPGSGNTIAYNGGAGIALDNSSTTFSDVIKGNRIFQNAGLGIDLGGDGVTPNDPGDADTGPNGLQNFPVLQYALSDGSTSTTVNGSLNSVASTTYTLDFYAQAPGTCDPSGYGEGQLYIGTGTVATDNNGNATFTQSFSGGRPDGSPITATATDPKGNTSEFSACVPVNGADLQITGATDTPDPVGADSPLTYSFSLYNAAGHDATNATLTVDMPATAMLGSASASQGSCTVARPVTCNIGTLPAGAHASVTVTVTPIVPGLIASSATFVSDQPDPTPANITLGTTVSSQPKTRYVSHDDSGFGSPTVVIGLGTSVQWNFLSGGTTDVFDATGMSLFTSPPTSPVSYYQYTFTAAGVYSVSDGAGHLMTVKVRLTGPATGATGTPFRVRWASLAPAPGFVFDVQVATPGGAFLPWKTGVTSTSALYTPGVAGTYRFRALIRNGSGTATYSPTLTMTVT